VQVPVHLKMAIQTETFSEIMSSKGTTKAVAHRRYRNSYDTLQDLCYEMWAYLQILSEVHRFA
jgi:hypothetical protein